VSGGAAGLQNQSGGRKVPGGFDSLPSPPEIPASSGAGHICRYVGHYNALYTRRLLEREYRKASRRLGASHLEYLKETELLEDLPENKVFSS